VFLGKELSTQLVSMFAVKEMVNILGSLRRNLYYDFISLFVGEFYSLCLNLLIKMALFRKEVVLFQ